MPKESPTILDINIPALDRTCAQLSALREQVEGQRQELANKVANKGYNSTAAQRDDTILAGRLAKAEAYMADAEGILRDICLKR